MGGAKQNMSAYRLSTDVALQQLNSNKKDGLTTEEAARRREQYGPNQLQAVHKVPLLARFLRQFKDLMILLLLGSSMLSFYLGDRRAGIVLLLLVLFNTLIGFFQEFKAEKVMESLEKLVVTEAKVLRDGSLRQIAAHDLVPGDMVYIEEGDSIPADLRLITESELATNDFALTGESSPSRKFTHAIEGEVELGNRHNLVFMGTTVAIGHGYGLVIGSGMQTELGRIASLSADTKTDASPLQRELNNIARKVTQGTIVLCSILLPIAIQADLGIKDAILFAIGIASSIIPQGLPAEINTSLAQAANKLVRARALVKKLSAVETLGATSIICTDKTGTLTKNEMTVQHVMVGQSIYEVSGAGYEAIGEILDDDKPLPHNKLEELRLFFSTGAYASNAHLRPPDEDHATWHVIGDPTEGALITLAQKAGLFPLIFDDQNPELKEFSFDSVRKRMSSIRRYGPDNQLYVFVKGAPESVLERCNDIWDHGHVRPMKAADKDRFKKQNIQWAQEAMRNLAYAYKVLPVGTKLNSLKMEDIESDLTMLGMVSIIDPIRDEVPDAMRDAHAAHIRISIVTGDFSLTAQAIATKAGLAAKGESISIITGQELRALDDAQVLALATKGATIFSRVSPEDKLRIVGLVKNSGHVVAVTGDGINDAPALKRADIGVAMGITGTDVAKQSAEIVLMDDSFRTLVSAVQQGRTIFQNIKKGTLSCFTSNAAELVVNLTSLAAASLFGIPLALTIMQILAVDLIAELFPIASLGWDKADHEIMKEEPRNPKHHILNRHSIKDLAWCGLLIGGLAYTNYILFFWRNGIDPSGAAKDSFYMKATAITYLTIILCQLLNILQRRSSRGLFTSYQFHNRYLGFALMLSLFCIFNIIYNPWIAPYFGAGPLGLIDWIFACAAAAIFVLVRELQRHVTQNKIFNL